VGVFLLPAKNYQHPKSLPHACGGVSKSFQPCRLPEQSSPRLWGCF